MMNVLITINKTYLNMAKDMLFSLAITQNQRIEVYLVYESLNQEDIEDLSKYIEQEKIGVLYPIYFDSSKLDLPMNISHITRETYFRLYAPFLLPKNLDRILFLDADIICTDNIKDFYNTNFDGNVFVAVENFDIDNYKYNQRLKLPKDNIYINAGVLLINLILYRKLISPQYLNRFIKDNYNILTYQDQDVINKLFNNYIKIADSKYNYQINMVIGKIQPHCIVHYSCPKKPWHDTYDKPQLAFDLYQLLEKKKDYERLERLKEAHKKQQSKNEVERNKALISVIVPVYNVEPYLEKCLQSIISQSINNLEIILIDDGSIDNSGKICDQYQKLDNRIIVIHQNNKGLSAARNRGLEIATGKYIGFVDSDDWIEKNMYEEMYNFLENNNLDIVTCNFYHHYENEKVKSDKTINNNNKIWDDKKEMLIEVLNDNVMRNFVWSKLYKKEFWKNIRFPEGKVYEDIFISIPLIEKAKKIGYLSQPLYYYRHRKNSITKSNSLTKIKDSIELSYKRYQYIDEKYQTLKEYNIASMLNRISCEFVENSNFLKPDIFFSEFSTIINMIMNKYKGIKQPVDELIQNNIICLQNKSILETEYKKYLEKLKEKPFREDFKNDRIDIIIPAYNAQKTIERTLCSIVIQNWNKYLDITIVNDNPKNNYHEFVNKFNNLISIKEITTPKNSGPGLCRQYGINNTKNEYIIFIDSDDIFYSYDAVEILYKKIKEDNSDIVVSDFLEELPNNKLIHNNSLIWLHGKIYKRKFLHHNSINFNNSYQNEDNGFNQLCILCSPQISYLNKITYVWKYNENSITRKNNKEFDFKGLEGYCKNMVWSIKEAEKRNGNIKLISSRVLSNYLFIYYTYLQNNNNQEKTLLLKWIKELGLLYEKYKNEIDTKEMKIILKNYLKDYNFDEKVLLPNLTFYDFHKLVISENNSI